MLDPASHDVLSELKSLLGNGIFVAPAVAGAPFYDGYPDAAVAPEITSGAAADTDGAAVTLVVANEITEPFTVTGLCVGPSTNNVFDMVISTLRDAESPTRRRVCFRTGESGGVANGSRYIPFLRPLACNPNAAITAVARDDTASARTIQGVAAVVARTARLQPASADLLRAVNRASETKYPTTSAPTALTASASGYGTPVYTQISAALATGILVDGLSFRADAASLDVQIGLATGGAGSEIPFAWFSAPKQPTSMKSNCDIALPWPILVPSGLRLSFCVRGASATSTGRANVLYFALPLDG